MANLQTKSKVRKNVMDVTEYALQIRFKASMPELFEFRLESSVVYKTSSSV